MAKILVVEDGIYLRDLYKQILEAEHYTVDVADDGEKALSMLQIGGYDLVLLDIKLPKKNGLDILAELKKTPAQQINGPIICLTCDGQDDTMHKAKSLGASKYMIKSEYNPGQIVEEIKKILEESQKKA